MANARWKNCPIYVSVIRKRLELRATLAHVDVKTAHCQNVITSIRTCSQSMLVFVPARDFHFFLKFIREVRRFFGINWEIRLFEFRRFFGDDRYRNFDFFEIAN